MKYKTIKDMQIGDTGLIINMNQIEKKVLNRFLDLGIAPLAKVELLNKVNFNQLYVIEVDDVEICIRQKDAKNIMIKDV